MKRKNSMPAYYGRNIAKNAQRRYMQSGKTEAQRIDDHREAVANVLCLCILAALYDKYGVGETRLQRVVDTANAYSQRFVTMKQNHSEAWAKATLENETRDILPGGFTLPVLKAPQKDRDWVLLHHQRDAAEMVFRIYAFAMHSALGFGAERVAAVAQETETNYREFGNYTEDGDYYGYAMLARKMSQILRTPVEVDTEDDQEPIFGKTLF